MSVPPMSPFVQCPLKTIVVPLSIFFPDKVLSRHSLHYTWTLHMVSGPKVSWNKHEKNLRKIILGRLLGDSVLNNRSGICILLSLGPKRNLEWRSVWGDRPYWGSCRTEVSGPGEGTWWVGESFCVRQETNNVYKVELDRDVLSFYSHSLLSSKNGNKRIGRAIRKSLSI